MSIPENSEAISIVFFANGIIQAEIDHIAVARQGENLTAYEKGFPYSYIASDEFREHSYSTPREWLESFKNLNFEE